jgi:Arc/MetJ-type ribon-helix-helix transcriptional regulator
MSKIDKISIVITREQHAKIKAAVDRGDYASTSSVGGPSDVMPV